MKNKPSTNRKHNNIITTVLFLLVTVSCGQSNTPDAENISGTSSSEIITENTTTEITTETTTTETTTETTTTETTTETTTTETTTKTTATEKTAEIVECPDLIGKEYEQAVKEYGNTITIEKIGEDYHSDILKGRIIEQDVEASSKIKKDTVIKVKVSMGEIPTETVPPETVPPVETAPPEPVVSNIHFILNTDTNCIHTKADCSAAQKILPENYSEIDISNSELANYANIYWACGKCSKEYSDILPKF